VSDFVTRSVEGAVATVTLNRPDLHNAFDDAMMAQLTGAFRELGADDGVRVIVLAAAGRSFSAGADLNWMKRMVGYGVEENVADATLLADMLEAIHGAPKPVIGRVQGAAFGGGVGLVAACDIALGTERASFCLSEVKLGIIPAVISPYLLERIGATAARRYSLTAERFGAAEALRVGLLAGVHADEASLDAAIAEVAGLLLQNGPAALAACKELWDAIAAVAPADRSAETAERIARIRVSPEGQEGLGAFLAKRKPSWIED
jgi:methylglutaconyl-CoA hydratase